MRRFLLWSLLAVIVGFGLAGVGYWAVWSVLAPRTATTAARHEEGTDRPIQTAHVVALGNADEVQRLLDETSWISAGDGLGDPVWIVGDREALGQAATRIAALKPGAALRIIPFAPADEGGVSRASGPDRATVAELWLSRDWLLYGRWLATAPDKWTAAGIPSVEQDTARSELIETGRRFVERLSAMTLADGLGGGHPVVIWRDGEGAMKACACVTDQAWKAVDVVVNVPRATIPEPAKAMATASSGPSYPNVAASPAVAPETPSKASAEAPARPVRRTTDRSATPARPAPARIAPERDTLRSAERGADRAPRAERQADSMFY